MVAAWVSLAPLGTVGDTVELATVDLGTGSLWVLLPEFDSNTGGTVHTPGTQPVGALRSSKII